MAKLKPTKIDGLDQFLRLVAVGLDKKFYDMMLSDEYDIKSLSHIITVMGRALGETLGSFEFPEHWRRYLKRKDCPKYMKQITQVDVRAYYPKRKIPEAYSLMTADNVRTYVFGQEDNELG